MNISEAKVPSLIAAGELLVIDPVTQNILLRVCEFLPVLGRRHDVVGIIGEDPLYEWAFLSPARQLSDRMGLTSRLKTTVLSAAGAGNGVTAEIPAVKSNTRHARWRSSRFSMQDKMCLSAIRVNLCGDCICREP